MAGVDFRLKLKEFKDEGLFVDFAIVVENNEFKAHKNILAASSDYFKTMFLQDTKEAKESKVYLEDISPTTVKAVIDFCYTSELELDHENVQEIICAASRLQITEAQELSAEFIRNGIDCSNCLGIYMLAKQLHLPDLLKFALEFCLSNFKKVVDEQEFLEVDETCLLDLISQDELDIEDEELVFQSMLKWARVDPQQRKAKLKELMYHVRFATIEPSVLIGRVASEPLIQDISDCQKYINQAKDFLLLQEHPEKRSDLGLDGQRFKSRNPLWRQQRIFAVGGWTNEYRPFEKVEKYDPYNDTWVEVSSMTKPRCGAGVAILGDSLFAVGGFDGQTYLNNVERYDIQKDQWHQDVANMKVDKTSFGLVTLGEYIYAIGGQVKSLATNLVDRYDFKTNTWKECAPLKVERLGLGVAVLGGLIYAIGGFDCNHQTLRSVERYDPEKDEWTYVKCMISPRKHLGCVAYDGRLYAVGGRVDGPELAAGECFNPATNTWEEISPMKEKRSGHALIELDGLLYAIGGRCGGPLKTVEAYDRQTNTWMKKRPMEFERIGAGVAVYSKNKHA